MFPSYEVRLRITEYIMHVNKKLDPAIRIVLLAVPIALCLSCLTRRELVRVTRPAERSDIDIIKSGSALIRSLYCDITAEAVDDALWRKLRTARAYSLVPGSAARQRIPPLTAFHVMVKNTAPTPIRIEKAQVRYGAVARDALAADEIAGRLKSPSYSVYNFCALLSPRRLLEEKDAAGNIDYDRDTISSKLDFVPPNDTVLKLIVFDRIPVEAGTFKLLIRITASGREKIIDFDFTGRDYRTNGEDYNKMMENDAGKEHD
ncbi:MAG: hypothetical protein A2176_09820 [Spirochaetes bacterium RBG_13_51_14]|nr:MAG: hypothetical protein A2176_09820 [Spirochaetes bacterium RBG_13_51_14]